MKLILSFLILVAINLDAQQHKLEKRWETDSVIAVPESVLPIMEILYISLIDGAGWTADSKGGVGKLTPDGKIIDTVWITGLNAPKGMGIAGNRLYVADMLEVIVIDIEKGKIENKIKIDSLTQMQSPQLVDSLIKLLASTKADEFLHKY